MKKLLPYLKPYTKECVISPLFKLLEAVFDLLVPLAVKDMIDVGIANADKPHILLLCGVLILFALVGLACSFTAQYFAAKAAVGFSSDLRGALFAHAQGFTYAQTDNVGTSTLITRLTADINQIQSGLNLTLRLLLRSPIIVFGAAIMAFVVDPRSAWIFAVVIPLLAVVVFAVMLAGVPLYRKVQQHLDRVTSVTRENLSGVRVIRAFRKETEETQRFEEANQAHNHMQNYVGRISALMNPITLLIVNGGMIVLLLTGASRVDNGRMTTGEVFAMTNYLSQILVELVKFANTIISVNKALACAGRVEAVLEMPVGMEQVDCSPCTEAIGTSVYLRHAELTYAGNAEPSVLDINLSVRPGEIVGLIGSTGSGKTSVINLITRFYDATNGDRSKRSRNFSGSPAGADRYRSSKGGFVPRNHPLQSSLGQRKRHRRGVMASLGARLRQGVCNGKGGGAGCSRGGRRKELFGWTTATPHHRPRLGSEGIYPHFGRCLLRFGLRYGRRPQTRHSGIARASHRIPDLPAHRIHSVCGQNTGAGGRRGRGAWTSRGAA